MTDVLTDTFERRHTYLRISLTERCNLRCRYCMPAEGVDLTAKEGILALEEIEQLTRLFAGLGVTKVRLTGGEPLIRPGVCELAARLRVIEGIETLAITTNGLLLPKKLGRLQDAGIDQLNISLDTLQEERFRKITRRKGLDIVLRGIDQAVEAGYRPKINCVVMRGENDDELAAFSRLAKHRPLEVRFIELMPFQGNAWSQERFIPFREMKERLLRELPALEKRKDGPHATARTYSVPGWKGAVGFIASMSAPFCQGCNRLRLTADGHLKVCLFDKAEADLRTPLRAGATNEELIRLINRAVNKKKARHAGMDLIAQAANKGEDRPMITIGG